MSKFSRKLKEFRWSMNLSMREFAESLDINENTYKDYDSGRRKPSVILLKKLVLVYDINLYEWIMEV